MCETLDCKNEWTYWCIKFTKKQVKPKDSYAADHLLFCNHSASCDDFTILTRENKKFLLELKECLLITSDQLSLHRKNYTITPFLQGLVLRTLLKFYLFLIVATLFLMNEFFVILSYVTVWAPQFTIMVQLNILSFWSWDSTLPLSPIVTRLL